MRETRCVSAMRLLQAAGIVRAGTLREVVRRRRAVASGDAVAHAKLPGPVALCSPTGGTMPCTGQVKIHTRHHL